LINKLEMMEIEKLTNTKKIEDLSKHFTFMEKIIQDLISRVNEVYYVDSRVVVKLIMTYFNEKDQKILSLLSEMLVLFNY
jgi:hypothetical protein